MLNNTVRNRIAVTTLLLLFVLVSATFGSKAGKEAGSPAGSYQLSNLDNVNLFSGNLNFNLPFLSIGGRGAADTTMSLNIQREWSDWRYIYQRTISMTPNVYNPPSPDFVCQVYYDWLETLYLYKMFCSNTQNSTNQVYVTDITFHNPIPARSLNPVKPGYGPGIMKGKTRLFSAQGCKIFDPTINAYRYDNTSFRPYQTQAFLIFVDPDGTEHEFVDEGTRGAVHTAPISLCTDPLERPRGTTWISSGDSSETFIADAPVPELMGEIDSFGVESFYGPSGLLLKKDGTRLRIDNGLVSWIRDRNGNRIDFTYDANRRVKTITDSLNRQTSIDYDVNDSAISADGTAYGLCDQINYKGFNETPRMIRITKTSLANALRSGYSPQRTPQLWPNLGDYGNGTTDIANQIIVASAAWLPDGRSYKFQYDSFAELARVELPTGGAIEYDHDYSINLLINGQVSHMPSPSGPFLRRVVQKRVYTDKSNSESLTEKTDFGNIYTDFTTNILPQPVVVDQKDKNNTLLSRTKHYFVGHPLNISRSTTVVQAPPWNNGLETQTEFIERSDGQTVLKRLENTWLPRIPAQGTSEPLDINLIEQKTTLTDTNLITKTTYTYDKFNNISDTYQFDFGTNTPSTYPIRHTHIDYVTLANGIDYADRNGPHIRDLPQIQKTFSIDPATGTETPRVQTEMKYDEIPLLPWYGAVQGWGDPGVGRGNITKIRRWLNTNNSWIETVAQYDQVGNVSKSWDAKNNPTETVYSSACQFAYPTQTISPIPDSTGKFGSTKSFVTNSVYDCATGLLMSETDANGQVTEVEYDDPLDRPTRVQRAKGNSSANQTTFNYDDTNRVITTTSDLEALGDNILKSQAIYDGLGRTIEARQYEDSNNYSVILTQYDPLGRPFKVSNAFRPWRNESSLWTTNEYDALGRVISQTTPDNALITTAYSGNRVLVSDQTGKKRISITDSLGRLAEVWEVTAADSWTEAVSFPNYEEVKAGYRTVYSYDTFDNLTTVTQASQTRTFFYDSLNRLISNTNPEGGTINYTYDNSGNPITRADARDVVSTNSYDSLNRLITRSYSDGTPSITYGYDAVGVTNSKGKLTSVSSTVSSYNYTGFDAVGRATGATQVIGGISYTSTYAYDLKGDIKTIRYPSGRSVNYTYDGAGRTSDVIGNLGDNSFRTYSSGIVYDAGNRMVKEKFGTVAPVYNKLFYNSRLQLAEIRVSTSYTGPADTTWDRGAIINNYSNQAGCSGATCNATDNNGNLMRQEIDIPNGDKFAQNYDYDSLNRLTAARETKNGSPVNWQQAYSYDRFGNRTIDQVNTFGTGIPKPNFAVNIANDNRLGVPSGQTGTMSYDAAGNLTTDTYSSNAVLRTYDAENRMTSETKPNHQVAGSYGYDGDGRRVIRNVNGVVTWQIYGIGAELLAEYAQGAPAVTPQKEYGYRNGELLVQATGGTGNWGSPPVLNDNPLVVTQTTIQLRHITELRSAIDSLRSHLGMAAYSWQQPVALGALVTANPILEMRTALDQTIGAPALGYSAGLAAGQPIKAVHIQELRDRVLAAWNGGSSTEVNWLITDQLGTPRMILEESGSAQGVRRHDYLPFGEEFRDGGRTPSQGYGIVDQVRQKFTGYERDYETSLDYAQARYYASSQGRFISVDPLMTSGHSSLPQTWNRYLYTINNPLKLVDPSGQDIVLTGTEEDQKKALERHRKMLGDKRLDLVDIDQRVIKEIQDTPVTVLYFANEKNRAAFEAVGATSYEQEYSMGMADIIESSKHVEYRIAESFTSYDYQKTLGIYLGKSKKSVYEFGGAATLNTWESLTGNVQIFVGQSATDKAYEVMEGRRSGALHIKVSSDGNPLTFSEEQIDAHEYGHAHNAIYYGLKTEEIYRALRWENIIRIRQRWSNTRIVH